MKIRQQLVSSRAKTWGEGSACSSITVHETANTSRGANAAAHANLQSRGNVRDASWHYQVDDTEVVQSFPDTVKCWHAGRAAEHSIAIEICVNSDGDYKKALANAAALVAVLRERHGLPRSAVKQHHTWTGKNCPTKLRASGEWSSFVASTDPTPPPPPSSDPNPKEIDDMFIIRRLSSKHPNRKFAIVSGGRAIEINRTSYRRLKKRTGQVATQLHHTDYDRIMKEWK